MRLVHIDGLTPGGRELDLHPRLSVLVGAPPETRALLSAVFAALVDGSVPPTGGQLEVHGIRMPLDRASLDLLDSRAPVDPVLDLDAPAPLRPAPAARPGLADTGDGDPGRRGGGGGGPHVDMRPTMDPIVAPPPFEPPSTEPPPTGPSATGPSAAIEPPGTDPARGAKAIAERELAELRLELRSVTGEQTVLARRMEETRGDLDSFARATLEVAIGQLEALEDRRAAAADEHAGWTAAVGERRAALVLRLDELRTEHSRLSSVDPDQVRAAADRLAVLLDPPTEPDPAALDLADRLDDVVRASEDLAVRRQAAEGMLADTERRLAEALEAAAHAQDAYRSPAADPAVVAQLERVRDEIYDLEERGGRLAAVRSKRRIDELRAEEAELLDRLGFDTYSSYVMGIPTARSEAARAMRLDVVQSRADVLQREVEQLRADSPGGAEDQWNDAERRRIVEETAALLGRPAGSLARLTSTELSELLRARVLPPPPETSAEILSAAGRLASTMTAAGAPTPTAAVAPRAMLVMATDWLEQVEDRDRLLADLRLRIDTTQQELAQLDEEMRRADDGGRSADLEAELLVVRARVAECETRVARHQEAMAELADLRTQELELRDRERDLLVRTSERERLLIVLGAEVPAPPRPPAGGPEPTPTDGDTDEGLPHPGVPLRDGVSTALEPADGAAPTAEDVGRDAGTLWPVDREWRLLARLGDVRSVAQVGSVPLLVAGVDAGSPDTAALLHRVQGMSELVQIVVLTDDERVARWAEGLGPDAGVLHW